MHGKISSNSPKPKPKKKTRYEKVDLSKFKREVREAVELMLSILWTACENCGHAIWWHGDIPGPCTAKTMHYPNKDSGNFDGKVAVSCSCKKYELRKR